jgi:hypothetical protein
MSVTLSDVAKAEREERGVRLDFGAISEHEAGGASDVRLQKRIVLDPESATSLLKLLNTLINTQNPNTR